MWYHHQCQIPKNQHRCYWMLMSVYLQLAGKFEHRKILFSGFTLIQSGSVTFSQVEFTYIVRNFFASKFQHGEIKFESKPFSRSLHFFFGGFYISRHLHWYKKMSYLRAVNSWTISIFRRSDQFPNPRNETKISFCKVFECFWQKIYR